MGGFWVLGVFGGLEVFVKLLVGLWAGSFTGLAFSGFW